MPRVVRPRVNDAPQRLSSRKKIKTLRYADQAMIQRENGIFEFPLSSTTTGPDYDDSKSKMTQADIEARKDHVEKWHVLRHGKYCTWRDLPKPERKIGAILRQELNIPASTEWLPCVLGLKDHLKKEDCGVLWWKNVNDAYDFHCRRLGVVELPEINPDAAKPARAPAGDIVTPSLVLRIGRHFSASSSGNSAGALVAETSPAAGEAVHAKIASMIQETVSILEAPLSCKDPAQLQCELNELGLLTDEGRVNSSYIPVLSSDLLKKHITALKIVPLLKIESLLEKIQEEITPK
jgi:hypothetical protein